MASFECACVLGARMDWLTEATAWGTCANPEPELTPGELAADDRRTLGERFQFGESELARDAFHAAIEGGDKALRWEVRERGNGCGRRRSPVFPAQGRPC
jgi:hypothetical protein